MKILNTLIVAAILLLLLAICMKQDDYIMNLQNRVARLELDNKMLDERLSKFEYRAFVEPCQKKKKGK